MATAINKAPIAQVKWIQVKDSSPEETLECRPLYTPNPRHGHRAVASGNYMIVYGGGNESIMDDLNVFDTRAGRWFQPITKGNAPPGCAAFGMALLDTRLLLFGGMKAYNRFSNDLYELNITNWEWKKLKPGTSDHNPPPRKMIGHSFTAFPERKQIFLFGGLTNDSGSHSRHFIPSFLNDLYVLNSEEKFGHGSWEMPVTCGNPPSPRDSHTAVPYDSKGLTKLIVYGGMCGWRLGDLHVLDLDTASWTAPEMNGITPAPRSMHSATVVDKKMYIFGGWSPLSSAEPLQDSTRPFKCTSSLYCFNLETMAWEKPQQQNSPPPRAGHSAVEINSRIYVWSGKYQYSMAVGTQVCVDDLWQLQLKIPSVPEKVHLMTTGTHSLKVNWAPVAEADSYVQEIVSASPVEFELSSKDAPSSLIHEDCSTEVTQTSLVASSSAIPFPTRSQRQIPQQNARKRSVRPSTPESTASSSFVPPNINVTASSLVAPRNRITPSNLSVGSTISPRRVQTKKTHVVQPLRQSESRIAFSHESQATGEAPTVSWVFTQDGGSGFISRRRITAPFGSIQGHALTSIPVVSSSVNNTSKCGSLRPPTTLLPQSIHQSANNYLLHANPQLSPASGIQGGLQGLYGNPGRILARPSVQFMNPSRTAPQ